jgi:hypothetical protein
VVVPTWKKPDGTSLTFATTDQLPAAISGSFSNVTGGLTIKYVNKCFGITMGVSSVFSWNVYIDVNTLGISAGKWFDIINVPVSTTGSVLYPQYVLLDINGHPTNYSLNVRPNGNVWTVYSPDTILDGNSHQFWFKGTLVV